MMNEKLIWKDITISYHEAGHAVVADHYNFPFTQIQLHEQIGLSGSLAINFRSILPLGNAEGQEKLSQVIDIAMAGGVAAMICAADNRYNADAHPVERMNHVFEGLWGDWTKICQYANALTDALNHLHDQSNTATEPIWVNWMIAQKSYHQTYNLIIRKWNAVDAVATALRESPERRLLYSDCVAIIRQSNERSDHEYTSRTT